MQTNLITDLIIRLFGVIRLLITPIILSTAEYGELGLISAIFLYANFADLGLQIHYEIKASMEPEYIISELKMLLLKLLPRLVISGIILSIATYLRFTSISLALYAFIFVITLNIDTLFQILLRQQKLYKSLALATFLQAFILTLLIGPMAHLHQVKGIMLLTALVPLISIAISFQTIYKLIKNTKQEKLNELQFANSNLDTHMTFYLFIGQILMMIWVTIDRLFLSHYLSSSELGLWNLGNMAGAILLGYANTWGTLKLPIWKKTIDNFLDKKFFVSYIALYIAGLIGLKVVTTLILKKYAPGIVWNQSWLTVCFFIGFVFICDCFSRSQITNTNDAKIWTLKKAVSIFLGILTTPLFVLFKLNPKIALMIGIMISCLTIYLFTYILINDKRKAYA